MSRLGARVLLHTNAALPIWFFRNRIRLPAPEEGESVRGHSVFIRLVFAVPIP